MQNDYRPKCSGVLWLGSEVRHGSFQLEFKSPWKWTGPIGILFAYAGHVAQLVPIHGIKVTAELGTVGQYCPFICNRRLIQALGPCQLQQCLLSADVLRASCWETWWRSVAVVAGKGSDKPKLWGGRESGHRSIKTDHPGLVYNWPGCCSKSAPRSVLTLIPIVALKCVWQKNCVIHY